MINKTRLSGWEARKDALLNEIDCMALINNNAKVTNLVSVHETEDGVLIVMELCHGGNLSSLMARLDPLNEPTAMWLFHQLLEGVAHCHSKGVVNRDIKLESVLVSNPPPYNCQNSPQLKLADFGLSGVLPAETHGTLFGYCGILTFMAPEVHRFKKCNSKADMWALGIILYMMLKHVSPFERPELVHGSPMNGETILRR